MLSYCCEPVDQIEGYIPEEKRTVKMDTDASARSLSAEKANRLKILEKLKH